MSDIDGDDLVRRLATRIAELEVANAMLAQQIDALRKQAAEVPDGR